MCIRDRPDSFRNKADAPKRNMDYAKFCFDLLDQDGETPRGRDAAAVEARREFPQEPNSKDSVYSHAIAYAKRNGMDPSDAARRLNSKNKEKFSQNWDGESND